MFGRWFEIADSMLSVCTDSVFVKYHWIYHEIWEFRPFNVHLLYSNKFTDNITEVMSVFALCVKNDYERVFFVSFFPLSSPYSFVFDPHAKINFGICLLVVLVVVNSFSFIGWQCNSAFWKLLYVILLFAVNNKKNVAFAMRQKWSPFVYSWACFMWWQNASQLGNWYLKVLERAYNLVCIYFEFVWLWDYFISLTSPLTALIIFIFCLWITILSLSWHKYI